LVVLCGRGHGLVVRSTANDATRGGFAVHFGICNLHFAICNDLFLYSLSFSPRDDPSKQHNIKF
jgi:hypothetical protein